MEGRPLPDDLAPDARILDLVGRDAERIDVEGLAQPAINELLAQLAGAGKRVVRLAAGDPFLLGQGGEELCFLGRRAITTEVVPGVALTHRPVIEARRLRRA